MLKESGLVSFTERHLDEAGALLAARHRRDRAAEPALPSRFAEREEALGAIEGLWRASEVGGVAALRAGRLIGYLIGSLSLDPQRGRFGRIELAGHALAADAPTDIYRELYTALATRLVRAGCFVHSIYVPASDRAALDAWFSLSFGQEQVCALRELTEADRQGGTPTPPLPFEIRRAGLDDLELVVQVGGLLRRYYADAPVFSPYFAWSPSELEDAFREALTDPAMTIWVAVQARGALGLQVHLPAEQAGDDPLVIPDRADVLQLAVTEPEARGQGIGRALTEHALRWAAAESYRYCVTDWRVTNLLASHFWPARGFRPVAYRLTRYLDPRIAWVLNAESLTPAPRSRLGEGRG